MIIYLESFSTKSVINLDGITLAEDATSLSLFSAIIFLKKLVK